MEDEIWDLYDKNGQKTGETVKRSEPIPKDRYHLGVQVCIMNSKKEMLIQQRQLWKASCPGMWDFGAGGSALSGETPAQAAMRETYEELGIQIDLSDVRPHFIFFSYDHLGYTYLTQMDIDLKDIKLQEEEVRDVRWATKEEVLSMIDSGEFCRCFPSFASLCFDMTGQYGVDMPE